MLLGKKCSKKISGISEAARSVTSKFSYYTRYWLILLTLSSVIIPPALFYWVYLAASTLNISFLVDGLSHVGFTSSAIKMGSSTVNIFYTPGIDLIGLCIWVPATCLSVLVCYKTTPPVASSSHGKAVRGSRSTEEDGAAAENIA